MGLTKKKKLTIEGQKPSNEPLPKAGTDRKRKRGHEEWEPPQPQSKVARKSKVATEAIATEARIGRIRKRIIQKSRSLSFNPNKVEINLLPESSNLLDST